VNAIKFSAGPLWEKTSPCKEQVSEQKDACGKGRRKFLATTALLGSAAVLAKAQGTDGGLAPVIAKENPRRKNRLVPFGAISEKNFYDKCTACQLCIQACPNGVLRPSTDLEHLLQPVMGFEKGYCRPECTVCSDVCPSGAIKPLKAVKFHTHIGVAKLNPELCISINEGVSCGNCERHCPVGAIRMVEGRPVVMEGRCIGCGACENLCPSRPVSAIHVEGHSVHHIK